MAPTVGRNIARDVRAPAGGVSEMPRLGETGRASWALAQQRAALTRRFVLLGVLLLVVVAISLLIGRYPRPYVMSPVLLHTDPLAQRLVFYLRLPRILVALSTGMALAAAGAVLQLVFRNPLVDPGTLGVGQGAAFGAAFAIVYLSSSPVVVEVSATLFAFVGLGITYALAVNIRYGDWVLRLVLAGIVSSALFSAGLGVLKYLADPLKELPDIVFWLLGGLWASTWREVVWVLPAVGVGLVILILMRWRVNLLALRDETAHSLGVAPARERAVVLIAAVTVTAVVVSVAGQVGWIGLIVPHLARRIVGSDAQRLLPASILLGGGTTVLCDNLARSLQAGEIPLSIVTSLFGAVAFVALFVGAHRRTLQ